MRPDAENLDVHAFRVGHREPFDETYFTSRDTGAAMQADAKVGHPKALVQAGFEHELCAGANFFGRLADHEQGAFPEFFVIGHETGRSKPGRHVHIVPAGVHGPGFLPVVLDFDLAGIVEVGLFQHGQGIHVGAVQDCRAFPVFQYAYDTVATKILHHFKAYFAQLGR